MKLKNEKIEEVFVLRTFPEGFGHVKKYFN